MRDWSYILCLMLGAVLTACSTADEADDMESPVNDAISYTVTASPTRTAFTGTTFPTDQTFRVWAYETGATEPLINGDAVSYDAGRSAWATAETYEWPGGSVDFYALWPATLTLNTADKTITHTVSAAVADQADILYDVITAKKSDQAVSKNPVKRYAVPITFHHALSQVAFKGKVKADNKEWTVSVSDIAICNVPATGKFSLTAKTWADLSAPSEFHIGMRSGVGALTFYEADGTTEAQTANLTADDGAMLLIPQTLTAWDNTTSVTATTGCYLTVTLHVRYNNADLFGTADSPVKAYVPFDNSKTPWESGKKYVYTLQFGGGLDADGRQQLQLLIVSSEISDWTDGTGGDLDAEMTHE